MQLPEGGEHRVLVQGQTGGGKGEGSRRKFLLRKLRPGKTFPCTAQAAVSSRGRSCFCGGQGMMAKAPTVLSVLLWVPEAGLLMRVSLRYASWVGPCPPLSLFQCT